MFVCDFGSKKHSESSFGNAANIVETRLPRRITPLHYGVRYYDKPLEFSLIFGAEQEMDRYQFQEVSNWLTGYQDYQWLNIEQPDMEHILYRCLIQSLTPIHVNWIPYAFEAKVVCDCPYGYSYPFSTTIPVNGVTKYRFYNDSTIKDNLLTQVRIEPDLNCRSFTITNKTAGTTTKFTDFPAGGTTILIDNENEIVTDESEEYDLYEFFNFQFFELVSGDNELILEGDGRVTISGRYLYNVGA